jgi:ABC-type ATPase with predicted acetyltransferase domain
MFCIGQLTLTIRIHLIRERPNPEMAPYLPAAEVVRQKDRKNPIQLKRNATIKVEEEKRYLISQGTRVLLIQASA